MLSEYEELVQALELVGIFLVECTAKRTGGTDSDKPLDTSMTLESAQRVSDSALDYRFGFSCMITQEGGDVANISATFVASYATEEPLEANEGIAQQFAQDVAVMAVYPYMREFAQSTAARLDLPNFTLGLVKRGEFVIEGSATPPSDEALK